MLFLKVDYDPTWILKAYERLPYYQKEVKYVNELIHKEAGYGKPSVHKQNKNSSAYGLGQFLNSTWKGTNIKKTDDGIKQISAMIIYCNNRYGSVKNAVMKWNQRGYYHHKKGRYQNGWY